MKIKNYIIETERGKLGDTLCFLIPTIAIELNFIWERYEIILIFLYWKISFNIFKSRFE